MEAKEMSEVKVGQGATMQYPQDRYPFIVTAVSKSGKSITVSEIKSPDATTGDSADYTHNGFPVWDKSYTAEELADRSRYPFTGRTYVLRLTKRGWACKGIPFHVGNARYRRDYSD